MGKYSNFGGMSLRRRTTWEEEDPTSGLANLADCMLVLSCGLMVALVVAWNIDLNVTEVSKSENYKQVDNVQNTDGDIESGGASYVDMGRIYQDPETGKLYMVEEEADGTSSSSSSGQSSASSSSSGSSTGSAAASSGSASGSGSSTSSTTSNSGNR